MYNVLSKEAKEIVKDNEKERAAEGKKLSRRKKWWATVNCEKVW